MISPFRQRLYQIAIDQGRWSGDIPGCEEETDRTLDEVEQRSLQHCVEHNPNIRGYHLTNLSRGYFKLYGSESIINNCFSDSSDPLIDSPYVTFVIQSEHKEQVVSRMSPDNRAKYQENVAAAAAS